MIALTRLEKIFSDVRKYFTVTGGVLYEIRNEADSSSSSKELMKGEKRKTNKNVMEVRSLLGLILF